ncbi:MAG TPA: nicotinate (nicotinamide) nucleotide adenylyltransferase [Candidatus Dormibacteraeota bacterium]|nr:nicotinate (nicotinamide) nucleotide adenylyltransferase [Candidatus Dormibacteraeota bacterium]
MRTGIFGGTFDPVHNAHLFLAESARLMEGLERVLFVPTNGHHYRAQPEAPIEDRCAMVRAAIAGNPLFVFEDADLRDDASGYTADLIPALREKYPRDAFTFIIGADSLVNAQWVRFDEVLESVERFVIAPRAGVRPEAVQRVIGEIPSSLRERVRTLNLPELPESGTLLRSLLSQHHSVRYLVPDAVWEYVAARGLYGYGAAQPA